MHQPVTLKIIRGFKSSWQGSLFGSLSLHLEPKLCPERFRQLRACYQDAESTMASMRDDINVRVRVLPASW